MYIKEISY